MEAEILEDLGLTKAEIKVYLALLELGKTKVGMVIDKCGLQSSVVHRALHSLTDKGLVAHVLIGKIKHYSAADPKAILGFIDQKKKSFEKILPELLAKQTKEKKESTEMFEGIKGLQNMFNMLIEGGKKGDVMSYFGARLELRTEALDRFYVSFGLQLKERGITSKGIHEKEARGKVEGGGFYEFRYTDQVLPPDLNVFGDKVAIISWSEKPRGVLINSPQVADRFREMWNSIWEQAKP